MEKPNGFADAIAETKALLLVAVFITDTKRVVGA